MDKLDYKKDYKELYQPKIQPSIIDVAEMSFIQIDGRGNPNEPDGEYKRAVETLYALAYTIKMSPKNGWTPAGYFDYVVPPLEGLWWLDSGTEFDYSSKSKFCWTAMIRQPEFVTAEVFAQALPLVKKKKPGLNLAKARLAAVAEGLCVQCMHIGSFDDEPATIEKIKRYIDENGLVCDLSLVRRHHEIYLHDPRKIAITKMKTVLRYPVKEKGL